jgi:hypothetical protein
MMKQRLISTVLALYVVLGTWKGYVAVFRPGKEEPWQIFPTPIAALPEADQTALENGIPVHSEKKLQQLLEDYTS